MIQREEAVVEYAKTPYPSKWEHILNAPLSEGSISVYLESLHISLLDRYVPSPMIAQSLLYFTLVPPTLPTSCPSPLSSLYKIINAHTTQLGRYQCIPTYPKDRDTPRWAQWEASSPTEKLIKKYMLRASEEGIWGLLWDRPDLDMKKRDTQRRRQGMTRRTKKIEADEDDDEEGKADRKVSERGWVLLKWLADFWEMDRERSGLGYSPAFLAQLPKQRDMQYDNPSLVLSVVRSALSHPDPAHLETSSRLITILINTAIPPDPPFHPSTLTLSLLPLLRQPLPALNEVLRLFHRIPKEVWAHMLIHAIEDRAGLRAVKAAERRKRPNQQPAPGPGQANTMKGGNRDFVSIPGERIGSFPPPTIEYTLKALLYTAKLDTNSSKLARPSSRPGETSVRSGGAAGGGGTGEIAILKFALITNMIQIFPEAPEWDMTKVEKPWRTEFEQLQSRSKGDQDDMDDDGEAEAKGAGAEEGISEKILMILDYITSADLDSVDDTL